MAQALQYKPSKCHTVQSSTRTRLQHRPERILVRCLISLNGICSGYAHLVSITSCSLYISHVTPLLKFSLTKGTQFLAQQLSPKKHTYLVNDLLNSVLFIGQHISPFFTLMLSITYYYYYLPLSLSNSCSSLPNSFDTVQKEVFSLLDA